MCGRITEGREEGTRRWKADATGLGRVKTTRQRGGLHGGGQSGVGWRVCVWGGGDWTGHDMLCM